jgi:hypothetical protein
MPVCRVYGDERGPGTDDRAGGADRLLIMSIKEPTITLTEDTEVLVIRPARNAAVAHLKNHVARPFCGVRTRRKRRDQSNAYRTARWGEVNEDYELCKRCAKQNQRGDTRVETVSVTLPADEWCTVLDALEDSRVRHQLDASLREQGWYPTTE